MLFLSFVLLQWDARDLSPSQLQLLHELVTWSFRIHVRLLMSDLSDWRLIRIEVVENNHSTNRPPIERANQPIRRSPTWSHITHARSSHAFLSFSKYTPRPPENYAKTKNYNKKTKWKENVETGWCPINRFLRKNQIFNILKKVERSQNQIWKIKTQWVMG